MGANAPLAEIIRPRSQRPNFPPRASDSSFSPKAPLLEPITGSRKSQAKKPADSASSAADDILEATSLGGFDGTEKEKTSGASQRNYATFLKWEKSMEEWAKKTRAGKPLVMPLEELREVAAALAKVRAKRSAQWFNEKHRLDNFDKTSQLDAEERALVAQIIAGNYRFGIYYAKGMLGGFGLDVAELKRTGKILDFYQAAVLGIVEAAKTFEDKGFTFPTHARFWVKKYVFETRRDIINIIDVSKEDWGRMRCLEAAIECVAAHGREPTAVQIEEFAKKHEADPAGVKRAITRAKNIEKAELELSDRKRGLEMGTSRILSLDAPLGDAGQDTFHEVVAGEDGGAIETAAISSHARDAIEGAMDKLGLTRFERRIIELAYLGEERLTDEEVLTQLAQEILKSLRGVEKTEVRPEKLTVIEQRISDLAYPKGGPPRTDEQILELLSSGTVKCLARQRITQLRQRAEIAMFGNRTIRTAAGEFDLKPGEIRGSWSNKYQRRSLAGKQGLLEMFGIPKAAHAYVLNDPIGAERLNRNLKRYTDEGIDLSLVPAHGLCLQEKHELETSVKQMKVKMEKKRLLEQAGAPADVINYVLQDRIRAERLAKNLQLYSEAGIDLNRVSGFKLCLDRDSAVINTIASLKNPITAR